jgi:iron complex transport system substrate-binding protein
MRICSLIPSATEMVFALGMGDSLVGVSHECDFPAEAAKLPKVTSSRIPAGLSASEIDNAVSAALDTAAAFHA